MDDSGKRDVVKRPSNLEIALIYARRGWLVVPVWSVKGGVCTCRRAGCKDAGKHPRTRHGHDGGTTDEKRIRTWKWETANIGIVTGSASGLFVLDIDPRNGGDATFARLVAELGDLPKGPRAQTGGGGEHLYFQYPNVPTGKPADWLGIDIKANGGMVVAPPSVHRSGKEYRWTVSGGTALPDLPETWLRAISGDSCYRDNRRLPKTDRDDTRQRTTPSRGSLAATGGDLEEFIEECIQKTLPTCPGKRHDEVFRLARLLQGDEGIRNWDLKQLRPCVYRWYQLTVERLGEANIDASADDNWFDFAEGWGKVKYPGEGGLMNALLERARQNPPPKAAQQYGTDELRLLVAFCRGSCLFCETGAA